VLIRKRQGNNKEARKKEQNQKAAIKVFVRRVFVKSSSVAPVRLKKKKKKKKKKKGIRHKKGKGEGGKEKRDEKIA